MQDIFESILISLISKNHKNYQSIIKSVNNLSFKDQRLLIDFLIKNKILNNFFYVYDLKKFNFNKTENLKIKNVIERYHIQSQLIIHEVLSLQKYFNLLEIDAIYLKGVSISFFEYKNIYLRPMNDIDILIDESQAYYLYKFLISKGYEVQDLKTEKGYKYNKNSLDLKKSYIDEILKKHHQLPPLIKKNISIEIHTRVTTIEDFQECPITPLIKSNLIKKNFYGSEILIPDLHANLAHQICHFALNDKFYSNVIAIFDIILLIEKNKLDIKKFISAIDNTKVRKAAVLSINLICSLSGKFSNNIQQLNEEIHSNSKEISMLTDIIKTKIFYIEDTKIDHMVYAKLIDKNRLKLLFLKLFPSKAAIKLRYHYQGTSNFKIFNYYLLHANYYLLNKSSDFFKSFFINKNKKNILKGFLKLEKYLN